MASRNDVPKRRHGRPCSPGRPFVTISRAVSVTVLCDAVRLFQPQLTNPAPPAMFRRAIRTRDCSEDLGYRPWSSSCFWRALAPKKRGRYGSDAGRQRPTGLRPEEVPPPDHPSRTVPGHEAEALLRESERSTSAEGQGSGAPQGEVRSPPRTPLSQEYSRWHASPVS